MEAREPELRRDARRNRDRILEAARELFGESAAVPMYDVARRAGVGQATLYRHFPDRRALLDAVSRSEFAGLADAAAQHGDRPDGLVLLLRDLARRMVRLRGLTEAIRADSMHATRDSRHDQLAAVFATPLAVGKAAGTLRADLELDDVFRMIVMIEGAVVDEPDPTRRWSAADRARQLLVDGVRGDDGAQTSTAEVDDVEPPSPALDRPHG